MANIALVSSVTSVSDSDTVQTLLEANFNRQGAYFFNDSTAALYIKFGSTATSSDFTVKVAAAGFYEMPTLPCYVGIITGIWASNASGAVKITELS